jgi:hypothetical protein
LYSSIAVNIDQPDPHLLLHERKRLVGSLHDERAVVSPGRIDGHRHCARPCGRGRTFAGSVDGAPLSIVGQYIEQQNRLVY